MAGSVLTQALLKFTIKDEPGFEEPFILTAGSTKWSVASDRKWIVCVRGGGPFKPAQWPKKDHDNRLAYFTKLLETEPPEEAITVSMGDLISWSRQRDLTGIATQITVGSVLGVTLNIRRLQFMLEGLPFRHVVIWDASAEAAMSCLGISAGGRWKAFLAGFPLEADDEPDVEDFNPASEQDGFSLAMEMDD